MSSPLIAIVDDDDLVRHATASVLRSMGYATCNFASAADFLAQYPPDIACVLSDFQMPGMSGLDLLAVLRDRTPSLPVIIMTAHAESGVEDIALQGGAAGFLTKPLDASLLERIITSSLG